MESDGKKRGWFDEDNSSSSDDEEEDDDNNGNQQELWMLSANFLLATGSMVVAADLFLSQQDEERMPMYTCNCVEWDVQSTNCCKKEVIHFA